MHSKYIYIFTHSILNGHICFLFRPFFFRFLHRSRDLSLVILKIIYIEHPVNTRRYLDVVLTLFERYGRWNLTDLKQQRVWIVKLLTMKDRLWLLNSNLLVFSRTNLDTRKQYNDRIIQFIKAFYQRLLYTPF